jgi:hypothetical protein
MICSFRPTRSPSRRLPALFAAVVFLVAGASARSARAQDRLLFCNDPEKIRMPGAHADARLESGRTYRIFFHYKNVTPAAGALVIALHGSKGQPLDLRVRKGIADPQRDPPRAGRQAMARFLSARETSFRGNGGARFAMKLGSRQVASGVLTVRADQNVRLRIYYRHNRWTVPGAHVVAVDAPRREVAVALSSKSQRQYFRIGDPEKGMSRRLDGTYGMLYAFKVAAPPGRRVRVSFSPRGGQGGLVGSIGGALRQSGIVPAARWKVFCEAVVGRDGVTLTTAPFGGVFYPVELMFQLM